MTTALLNSEVCAGRSIGELSNAVVYDDLVGKKSGFATGFAVWMERQPQPHRKGKSVDPFVVLSWVNIGLSVLSNGLSLVAQALSLIVPFL
ncbi:hypothetical protein [Nocardia sp. NPDC052112]|uniref:hypothetical protein n=1 Tax=Nocardia sp. NPDC052112 TaxID=3155646 RepID=UPI003447F21D